MRLAIALLALLAIAQSFPLASPALADSASAADTSSTQRTPPEAQPCPAPAAASRLNTAEVSQADCCKGHKGVCGCRAGKIVCCDNTVSPNCTCHSDWSIAD
jgi:hypothetical protein